MRHTGKARLVVAVLAILVFASSISAKNVFTWRTVLWPSAGPAAFPEFKQLLTRMKAIGYNGIHIDGIFMRKIADPKITVATQDFAATAKSLGIEVLPMSQYQLGNSYMPQNLREALPNYGTPFIVQNGEARVKGDTAIKLSNGDFEASINGTWTGIRRYYSIDTTIKHSGNSSARCDNPTQKGVYLSQVVRVKPYRTYQLSAWIKSANVTQFDPRRPNANPMWGSKFTVFGGGKKLLDNRDWRGIGKNQNWKQIKDKFSSLQYGTVTIRMNTVIHYPFKGTVWIDDVEIREVGLMATSERQNTPVVVRTLSNATLTAGVDYVAGDQELTIPAGSSVKDGDELLVDWYTRADVFSEKAEATFCYNEVYDGMREEIRVEDIAWNEPRVRNIHRTEWRLAGWDPMCIQRYDIAAKGSGPYMAETDNNIERLYKEANGSRETVTWSDMYDPFHNSSKSGATLVNGGSLGSGHCLSESIIIGNWNHHNRKKSVLYFAGMDTKSYEGFGVKKTKHRQILCVQPHSEAVGLALSQLDSMETYDGLPDNAVMGINYFWWGAGYWSYDSKVENLAQACIDAGRWGSGPIPLPEASAGIPWEGLPEVGIATERNQALGRPEFLAASVKGTGFQRSFRFVVLDNKNVRISIFNLRGQKVANVMDEQMAAGTYERKIDVSKMASGVYFARLEVAGEKVRRVTRKMIVF